MSDHSGPSHLKLLFEAALQDYEAQTGIALPLHPLAERLQECHSVESITAVLHEQTQAFNQFQGKEKLLKSLKNAVSVTYKLSAYAQLGGLIGVVHVRALMRSFIRLTLIPSKFSLAEAIHSGLAVLLTVFEFFRSQSRIFVSTIISDDQGR